MTRAQTITWRLLATAVMAATVVLTPASSSSPANVQNTQSTQITYAVPIPAVAKSSSAQKVTTYSNNIVDGFHAALLSEEAIKTEMVMDVMTQAAKKPVEWQELGELQIYGYNPYDPKQVGKKVADGITASGEQAVPGETCAMYKGVPFGTKIYIDGLGYYTVNDRGVGDGVVDVAMATDTECYAITRKAKVWIVK